MRAFYEKLPNLVKTKSWWKQCCSIFADIAWLQPQPSFERMRIFKLSIHSFLPSIQFLSLQSKIFHSLEPKLRNKETDTKVVMVVLWGYLIARHFVRNWKDDVCLRLQINQNFPCFSPCVTGWRKMRECLIYKIFVQIQVVLILFSL